MAININAKTSGVGGLETTADNTGNINIQSGGSTVMSVTSSGVAVTGSFSQNGAVYSTQPSFRNLIINGDMRIAQRGTSETGLGVTVKYANAPDRVKWVGLGSGTYAFTASQDTDVPSGQGFANSYKVDNTTAQASLSADAALFLSISSMEGQNLQQLKKGTANAESLTASFWVKSNKTGTYICELYDADNIRHICSAYTISSANTWEKKTITFAGDTTGAFDNDNARSFEFITWLAAGSNYTSGTLATSWASLTAANRAVGQTNLADSTSNYINITGVQLEAGSTATDFENLPYDVELARCQRYYYKWNTSSSNNWVAWAMAANTTNMYGHVPFPTTMRNNPSSIDYQGMGWWLGGAVTAFSAVGIAESGTDSCTMNFTSTGLTAQKMYAVLPNGSTNYIAFNSEL